MKKNDTFCINVIFFEGISFLSKLIRFFTRSKISHVGFLFDDNYLLEAWYNKKTKKIYWCRSHLSFHTTGTAYKVYTIKNIKKETYFKFKELCNFIDFCKIPYDFIGVICFLIPFKLKVNGHWFCSEGVFEVLKYLNILKTDSPGWKISPDILYEILSNHPDFFISKYGVVIEENKDVDL